MTASQGSRVVGMNPILYNLSTLAPSQLYNNQFQGMLFFGFGWPWRRLYLGNEVLICAASHTSMDFRGEAFTEAVDELIYSFTSYQGSAKSSTCQYGFDLRPGILLTPLTLIYGRLGVSAAEIKVRSDALSSNNQPEISWLLPNEASEHKWKAALRLELGAEQMLSSKLHLRADYIFTNFGIVAFNAVASGQDSLGDPITLESNLSSHLQNHAIVFGLSYYFH